MKNNILVSEHFSSGRRHYFLDFKRTSKGGKFIQITRSELQEDGSYDRHSVVVFEEDFECLVQSFSYLFYSAAYYMEGWVDVGRRKTKRPEDTGGIKGWQEQDRPREKMLARGPSAMSDAELLAMLIGSGTPKESTVGLAGRILEHVGFDLLRLAGISYRGLCAFPGMGMAKSCTILAALELGRRQAGGLS